MKYATARLGILFAAAAVVVAPFVHAQSPGWQIAPTDVGLRAQRMQDWLAAPHGPVEESSETVIRNNQEMSLALFEEADGSVADEITPEIEELAAQLQYDPLQIYNFCLNKIDYEHYWGSKKGAALTYLEGSGNAFDTASLMVALLRESSGHNASITSVKYHYGVCWVGDDEMASWYKLRPYGNYAVGFPDKPFDNLDDGTFQSIYVAGNYTPEQLHNLRFNIAHWLFSLNRGYPMIDPYPVSGNLAEEPDGWGVPHVWVQVVVSNVTYELDASYKLHHAAGSKIDLGSATGYAYSNLTSAVGGYTANASSIQDLNEANLASELGNYTANLTSELMGGARSNDSVDQILGRQVLDPYYATNLADESLIPDWNFFDTDWLSNITWDEIPNEWLAMGNITLGVYNGTTQEFTTAYFEESFPLAGLAGRKISLTFNGNIAYLHLDEEEWANFTLTSNTVDVGIGVNQPFGYFDDGDDWAFVDDGSGDSPAIGRSYRKGDTFAYAVVYGYSPDGRLTRKRQEILDGYLHAGLTSSDWRVQTELLNVIGLTYLDELTLSDSLVASQFSVIPQGWQRFGRVAQEEAYYLDMFLNFTDPESYKLNSVDRLNFAKIGSLFASALEHGVLEQLQGTDHPALSTMKVLQLANSSNITIYRADASSWSGSINATLYSHGWPAGYLSQINAGFANNGEVLLPESPNISLGNWTGLAWAELSDTMQSLSINGVYDGGYASEPGSVITGTLQNSYTTQSGYPYTGSNSLINVYATQTQQITSPEPVDLATGGYLLDKVDLALGGGSPRGLAFARSYNSLRRHDNSTGLGYGWTHNLNIFAIRRSNMEAGLGQITPYQAAPYLAAITVAKDMFVDRTTAKDWLTACLAATWGVDQLGNNSVAVTMGSKTIEFTKMPDGSYVPQPGLTLNLTVDGGGNYTMAERHGNSFHFDSNGKIGNITDLYGKTLTFTYGNTGRLDTVTDCYSRNLTFTWDEDLLTDVADSTGREVHFDYEDGNLTTVTDADDNDWVFTYDEFHRMTELRDPKDQVLVQNVYNEPAEGEADDGRVISQLSEGDEGKTWNFYYSGFVNTQEDPEGGMTLFYYDERGRIVSIQDAFGNRDQRVYDGQDHVVAFYTAQQVANDADGTYFEYDANNNLTSITDALGNQTIHAYEDDDLMSVTDARGHTVSAYTYNDKHQALTIADTSHTTLTYGYNTANGTIANITDASSNTTVFHYDGDDNADEVHHPDSAVEYFTFNRLGDVTQHVDGRGNTTTFTYNDRRLPLVTTLPGNAIIQNTYDECGNLWKIQDARGNLTVFTYSPTGKRLTTTLPGGANITNAYDSRDWLESTADPLGHATTFTYDAAGRVIEITDALSHAVQKGYDENGRVTSLTDATGNATAFAYNARGDLTVTTDALTHTVTNGYDEDGNRNSLTNRLNNVFAFNFDNDNRLYTTTTPGNRTTTNAWNSRSLLESVTKPSSNNISYTYDSMGRVATSSDPVGNISFGYDGNGNLLSLASGNTTISRTYDARNRITSYTDANGNTLGYGYDDNNNLTSLTYPGNHTVTYGYDARNQLVSVTDWSNRTTSYTYDAAGRLTGVTRPNGTSRGRQYDNANRLTRIDERKSGGNLFASWTLTYDDAGRTLTELALPLPQAFTVPAFSANYDVDNRLSQFGNLTVTHDEDGNMLTGPLLAPNATANYTFNERNQLVTVGNVTNLYDLAGTRTGYTVDGNTTTFVVDPNAALSRVLLRTQPDTSKTYYIYGAQGLLYEIDESDDIKTYHADPRGSTAYIVDDDGATITDHVEYDPYGGTTTRTGTTDTPFLYNGAFGVMTDPNGLLCMRARFYNPLICRFVNADPIGFEGGLNWYAFADGNPINKLDPFGLWSWWDVGQGTLNFLAGAGNAVSFGATNYIAERLSDKIYGEGASAEIRAASQTGAFKAGEYATIALGGGRLAYAGAAKAGSLMYAARGANAANALAALTFRNTLKKGFRLGLGGNYKMMSMEAAELKYGVGNFKDIIAAAGRTSPKWNGLGAMAYFGGNAAILTSDNNDGDQQFGTSSVSGDHSMSYELGNSGISINSNK